MAMAPCVRLPTLATRSRSIARPVVCQAGGEGAEARAMPRRAALMMSVPLLLAASPARSEFLELEDSRRSGAKEAMESADQARDDNLDERRRFSFETVGKMDVSEHQDRAKESFTRLTRDVKQYLDKNLLNRVSNELGLQIGSLRYDLEQIANQKDKSSRKAAQKESKDAIRALEQLDLYARLKKSSEANDAYSVAVQKLGNVVKAYG